MIYFLDVVHLKWGAHNHLRYVHNKNTTNHMKETNEIQIKSFGMFRIWFSDIWVLLSSNITLKHALLYLLIDVTSRQKIKKIS